MQKDTRLQNFFLPMVAGAVLAIPAFLLTHQTPTPAEPAAVAAAQPEPSCGPFAEAFSAMRIEADRIASMASASVTPAEGGAPSSASWAEIHAAARALDSWVWEANSESAPLTLREAAVLTDAAAITGDLRWEVAEITGTLTSQHPRELDSALAQDMQSVVQKAGAVARMLDPLVLCREVGKQVSYAPHKICETLDPEYQYAMNGACIQ